MRIACALLLVVSTAAAAAAAETTRLVPSFAEAVAGVNGSLWKTEIRLFNNSPEPQLVAAGRIYPLQGVSCSGFAPLNLPAGHLAQVKSIGCSAGGAAAIEIVADERVEVQAVTFNIGASDQVSCCYTGFAATLPVENTATAYSASRHVSNLALPFSSNPYGYLVRHNVGVINPNDFEILVQLAMHPANNASRDETHEIPIPPRTLIQIGDYFKPPSFGGPAITGYWRVSAVTLVGGPFYLYDAQIDNTSNDATFIGSVAGNE